MENILDIQMIEALYDYYSNYELMPKEWLVPDCNERESLEDLAEQKIAGSLDQPHKQLLREYQKAHKELMVINSRMDFARGILCGMAMGRMVETLSDAMPSSPPVEIHW